MKFIFDSHGGDNELNARTGQSVIVLRELTEQEADIADVGKMFRIRFEDRFETDAFADELTLDEFTPLNNKRLWDILLEHWAHNVRITKYGDPDAPASVCLECDDCGMMILDAELYTLCARKDRSSDA